MQSGCMSAAGGPLADVFEIEGVGRVRLRWRQGRIIAVESGAVRADDFGLISHVDKNMRMVEGRFRADAFEFLRPDMNDIHSCFIVEFRR